MLIPGVQEKKRKKKRRKEKRKEYTALPIGEREAFLAKKKEADCELQGHRSCYSQD